MGLFLGASVVSPSRVPELLSLVVDGCCSSSRMLGWLSQDGCAGIGGIKSESDCAFDVIGECKEKVIMVNLL